jgi:glycolate oxidase iron-sulfur subunit
MAIDLLDDKMRVVGETSASTVATANPGCMMQLEAGARRHRWPGEVLHVIEMLDRAYQAS